MRAPPEIVEPDHRRADIHRLVHDFADLFGVRFAQRPAKDGKILAEDKNQPPVHRAVAGDHAIAGDFLFIDAEIVAAVLDEHVPFLEGTGIEQQVEPLARGQLAAAVLGLDAARPAAGPGRLALSFQAVENFLHVASRPMNGADSIGAMGKARAAALRLADWMNLRAGMMKWRRASCTEKARRCDADCWVTRRWTGLPVMSTATQS